MFASLGGGRIKLAAIGAGLSALAVAGCGVNTQQSVVVPSTLGERAAASPGQSGLGVQRTAAHEARAATATRAAVDGTVPLIPVPNAQNVAVTTAAPTRGIVTDGSGKLTVVNLATRTVAGKIDIPYENFFAGTITAQPGSPFVYVGNNQGNYIAIVNAVTMKFVKAIALPEGPSGGAYVTNGFITMGKDRAYVLNSFWSGWAGMPPTAVTRIDLKTQAVVDQLVMPEQGLATPVPANGVLGPDEASIYVAAWGNGGQGVFQLTFPVPGQSTSTASPGTMWRLIAPLPFVDALTGSGSDLYATQDTENHATRISVATNTVTGTIPFAGGSPAANAMISSVFVTPDGRQLWAGDYYADHVDSVNLASKAIGRIGVPNLSGDFTDCHSVSSVCIPTAAGIALVKAG